MLNCTIPASRSVLTIRSNEVLFLFGAGASKAFGIPTMKEMANLLKNNLEGNIGAIYREISETLEKNSKQGVDIEAVFATIEYLLNKDKYVNQSHKIKSYGSIDWIFTGTAFIDQCCFGYVM